MTRARQLALIAACLLLGACASMPKGQLSPLATYRASPNHTVRAPQLIVLHYTVEPTFEGSEKLLTDAHAKHPVSAHYLVNRDGRILQLVPDHLAAWQAGAGRWAGMHDMNSASIGIEIVNTGSEPFPDAQIDAVIRLLADICQRHGIPKTEVIGHADLAPGRKIDPGKLFPWKRLAEAGFGRWPRGELPPPPPGFDGWNALRLIGYDLRNPRAALHSFRLHYRGLDDGDRRQRQDGGVPELEAEDLGILYDLMTPRLVKP